MNTSNQMTKVEHATTTLRTGDRIRFTHHDTHGRFEVNGEVHHLTYNNDGELEHIHVTVGNRHAAINPCQILDPTHHTEP